MNWTSPADLTSQVHKWWERGQLLAELLAEDLQGQNQSEKTSFPRRLTLKVPTSSQMSAHFDRVRSWIAGLQEMPYFRVEMREFNHRLFGRNAVPSEVWLDSLDDAVASINKTQELTRFAKIVNMSREREPRLLTWLAARPLLALEHHQNWSRLLAVTDWLRRHPRPDIYLRQVNIAGADSKFIEENRSILSEIFDAVLPPEQIDADACGISQFNRRYGFKDKPLRIRFRVLDPRYSLLPGKDLQDITLDAESWAQLNPEIERVFITENEINFLAFPPLSGSMVVFGAGYGLAALSEAMWLLHCRIYYWGDIDTHGFGILNKARTCLPHLQSFLMDEETLAAHLDFAVSEKTQHSAEDLRCLTPCEQKLFKSLKAQKWKENLRLEQELISWDFVCDKLSKLLEAETALRLPETDILSIRETDQLLQP